jgi:hypothetical protein
MCFGLGGRLRLACRAALVGFVAVSFVDCVLRLLADSSPAGVLQNISVLMVEQKCHEMALELVSWA